MCYPFVKTLEYVLPINKLPELAFLIIVSLFFIATDFILTVVSMISVYTHLSHILIGTTLISWGSCSIEVINLTIAAKKNEMQLGLTSIVSAVVLTFLIIMPLAMVFKMLKRQSSLIDILQINHTSHQLFLPVLFVSIIVGLVFWKTKMQIGKGGAIVLIMSYMAYLGVIYVATINDLD